MATTSSRSTGKDVCDLLDADHRAVKKLFKEFEELGASRARNSGQKKLDLVAMREQLEQRKQELIAEMEEMA